MRQTCSLDDAVAVWSSARRGRAAAAVVELFACRWNEPSDRRRNHSSRVRLVAAASSGSAIGCNN